MLRSLLSKAGVNSRSRKKQKKGKTSVQGSLNFETQSTPSGSSAASQPRPTIPSTNTPASPGIFAGSSNVDASHSNFINAGSVTVAGDLIQNIAQQDNGLYRPIFNKLPRAEGAAWRSGNHETCLAGTRKAELRRIKHWEVDNTTKVICWLSGLAGSGKSTIAQTFAEYCHAEGRLGASFFCSRDFSDRRNVQLIFPTLAYYLALHSPEFRDALIPLISRSPDIGKDSLAVQFDELLIQPLLSTKIRATIVIDALDECEDRESTSAILSVIARRIHEIPFVKFFITGRPEPRIQSGFRLPLLRPQSEVFALHEVDRMSVDEDIELYLRTNLSQIAADRGYQNYPIMWPSNEDISAAVKKCAGLFIVASIIVKFVASRRHKPRERLRTISNRDSTIHEGKSGLDATYDQVFLRSFDDIGADDAEFLDLLQIVVGSIVLVLNPVSCASLATILGMTTEDVWIALSSLHSVFIVPESELEAIRLCHKSLADYLTDATRCTDPRLYINPSVFHLELAIRCLRLMNASLRRNICNLPRYGMNADVEDLAMCREKYIGSGLEYACKSWARHIQLGSKAGESVEDAVRLLEDFSRHHLLQWLEVLSIANDFGCAIHSLNDVTIWLADVVSSDADLLAIMKDSKKFVLQFFDGIEQSATHIYESAIIWSPTSSLVLNLYLDQMPVDVKITSGLDDTWDACVRTIQLQHHAYSVTYSHKDDLIAVSEDRDVEIFEVATGQRRVKLSNNSFVGSLAFSPDDAILVTGGGQGRVRVWDLQTGGLVDNLEGHTDWIRSTMFSPDGTMIATSSDDCTIRIWDISSRDCRCVLEGHSRSVYAVCWSATGNEVISGSTDTTIKVWSIFSKKCSKTFIVHDEAVYCVTCSPNSSLVASGSIRSLKVLDTQTGDVLHTIPTTQYINLVQFLDWNNIMYGDWEMFVIRDLTQSADVLTFTHTGQAHAISSDGTRLATNDESIVKIWQTNTPDQNQDMAGHHTDQVNWLSFSRDGQLAASGSWDKTAKIWDTSTGQCITTFRGHWGYVMTVSFSPDSTVCGSWGIDRFIRIWDVQTGNQISTFSQVSLVRDMCFSPNGNQLAYVKFGEVKLLEVATGNCLASMQVEKDFHKISFGVGETSVILTGDEETQRLQLSSVPHESDTSNSSSLPMVFVLILDTDPTLPDLSPRYPYHHDEGSSWILDGQDRRTLWVPPDFRQLSNSCGKTFAFGSSDGIVAIVNFRV